MYINYSIELEMSDLKPLYAKRENKLLDFSLKCIKHPKDSRLFPLNPNLFQENHDVRKRELFKGLTLIRNQLFLSARGY